MCAKQTNRTGDAVLQVGRRDLGPVLRNIPSSRDDRAEEGICVCSALRYQALVESVSLQGTAKGVVFESFFTSRD